jgi:hypothetical protein
MSSVLPSMGLSFFPPRSRPTGVHQAQVTLSSSTFRKDPAPSQLEPFFTTPRRPIASAMP